MFSKKFFCNTIFIVSLSTPPLVANAGFDTYNHTNEDSSVRITSGDYKPCSMDFGIYTPKQNSDGTAGHSSANDSQIKALCVTSKNNLCTANIYNTNNCTGKIVGHAELNLQTYKISSVASDDSRYSFNNQNGTRLDITYTNPL